MEERAGSLRYLPQLDGLRALAVAFVLWHHLSRGLWTTAWLAWGWFGVRLFFVLSGFLITRILVRERERVLAEEITRKEALVNFYARRSLRIFPVYYTYVLIDTIIRMVVFHQDCPALGWYLVYVQNFGFAAGLPAVNLHLWTLAVEEQFYWFWPLVVLFLPARHLKRAIVAMIGLGVLSRACLGLWGLDPFQIMMLPVANFDSLGLGALLALSSGWRIGWSLPVGSGLMVFHFGCFHLAGWERLAPIPSFWSPQMLYFALGDLGAALLFVAIVGRAAKGFEGSLGRFLSSKPLVHVGRISYGIYVYHMGILLGLLTVELAQARLWALVLTLLAAEVSWFALERPWLSLKRYFGS